MYRKKHNAELMNKTNIMCKFHRTILKLLFLHSLVFPGNKLSVLDGTTISARTG